MHNIFVSYSRKDLAIAKKVKAEIEKMSGANCWMDMDGIESGEQFEDVIISAIDNTKVVVFLLSENSMQSKWVKDEVRYACETHKRVIPVKIDNSELRGWFLFKFSGLDVIMYNNAAQKNKMIKDITEWVGNNTDRGKTQDEFYTRGPDVSSIYDKPNKVSNKLSYFTKDVKWGIRIQTFIFGLITLFFLGFLFMKGPIGTNAETRINDMLLVLELFAMIGFTLMIKKNKWCKWSFLILDLLALYFIIGLGRDSYLWSIAQKHSFNYWGYKLLYGLGWEYKVSVTRTWGYFIPLYIFHNVCVLAVMYSRTIWHKLPYTIRKMTK